MPRRGKNHAAAAAAPPAAAGAAARHQTSFRAFTGITSRHLLSKPRCRCCWCPCCSGAVPEAHGRGAHPGRQRLRGPQVFREVKQLLVPVPADAQTRAWCLNLKVRREHPPPQVPRPSPLARTLPLAGGHPHLVLPCFPGCVCQRGKGIVSLFFLKGSQFCGRSALPCDLPALRSPLKTPPPIQLHCESQGPSSQRAVDS